MNIKLFLAGFVVGLMALVAALLLGLDIEQSSYLQLYNFNEAVASGRCMVLTVMERNREIDDGTRSAGFLDEYKIDGESGAGWCVPMACCLSKNVSPWATDESEHVVMLFMWRGRPFCVFTLGGGTMPKICTVRSPSKVDG